MLSRQPGGAELPLFEAFPKLAEQVPWMPLGDWPTPITEARRFAALHGLSSFHVKREDLSHAACGGNKVRGLEFLLARARQRGATALITIGAAGSHHVCKSAWHGRTLGMKTTALIVDQPPADYVRHNLLAGLAAGASYIPANYLTLVPKFAWRFLRGSRSNGGLHYIPPGGTSPLACLGHVNAALELRRQIDAGVMPEPDYLFAAMGSLGTVAGLAVGCKLAGLRTRLVGVVVSYRWYCTRGRWARMARRTLRMMRHHDAGVPDVEIAARELTVIGSALGDGYAHFTEAGMTLAREFHACQQIQLDGTYTAKTLDGAMQFIRQHSLEDKAHLFWNSFHDTPAPTHVPANGLPPALRAYFSDCD
jgi:D-cysteine desulfhydrase